VQPQTALVPGDPQLGALSGRCSIKCPSCALEATDPRVESWRKFSPARVSASASKTSRARWVQVPPDLFAAVSELVPRDDTNTRAAGVPGFSADRFRTALTRACTAAGVAHFSPHDLRHRRISLLHLSGVPWARIGEHVGQRSLRVTADTYSHVLSDERERDYTEVLR
jgi:integrase